MRQVVRAEGGFAYGVIGADIHVFGDGRPVYLLRRWQGAPEADPEWLLELPSRMLSARHEVVPFTGRAHALAELRRWRDMRRRLAARWLHGPGGQGKTRLAARLAAESAAAGWLVMAAVHGAGPVLPPPGSQDLRAEHAKGVLVVVDYADHWPLSDLAWLLSNALLHGPQLPARVLLLARDAMAWPAVRATLADVQAAVSSQVLEPLTGEGEAGTGEESGAGQGSAGQGRDAGERATGEGGATEEGGERGRMFRAARDAFAACHGLTAPEAIRPPVSLAEPEFGLTLAVHMAALVAVDAHRAGRRTPTDAAGLTAYLLDREQRHWARLADTPGHTTPPAVMNRVVFAAALTGAVERPTGTAAVAALELPLPAGTVLADHTACYPPADPALPTVLEPLTPDRLAEDFLALTLPGHPADYPAHDWAPDALGALLPRTPPYAPPPRTDSATDSAATATAPAAPWLPRALTLLANAAGRWPHLRARHLYPLLRQAPWLAVAAGGAALGALVRLADLDPDLGPDLLAEIEAQLPHRDDADLDPAAAALAVRLAEHRLAATDDPAVHAAVHHNLGWSLAGAGRYDESMAASERAVALYRDLARTDPERYERDLARALNGLATELGRERRGDEALRAIEEAVAIRRRRRRPGHGGDTADLALSLSNHARALERAGRWLEALAADREALELYAGLAASHPGAYGHDLAITLLNFGGTLHGALRLDAALAATRRAVALLRPLARHDPAAHEGMLAQALANLAALLVSDGSRHEVLVADRIRRGGVPDPALLRLRGWRTEALAASTEAVEIDRRGARANPAALEGPLAGSLRGLGRVQQALGLREGARLTFREAEALAERVDPRRQPHRAPDRASYGTHSREAVIAVLDDAVITLYRWLCRTEVTVYGPHLAMLLRSAHLSRPREEARDPADLAYLAESLEISRRLADADPDTYESEYLHDLHQYAGELRWAGRRTEAVETLERAVALARDLAVDDPAAHGDQLLRYADELATLLKATGRRRAARAVRRSARRHLQELQDDSQGSQVP